MTQTAADTYDQQVSNQHQAPDPAEISVAILYPGNRVEKMSVPLFESRMDVAIEPPDPYSRDIVVVDNADRELGKEVVKNKFTDAILIYRMRGDVFHELDLWGMNILKEFIAKKVVLRNVDGCIAVTSRLANTFRRKTDIHPVGAAGLWKKPEDWPTVEHTETELRAVTLTNLNYWEKVKPIPRWAPTVENVLEQTGGYWRICGRGTHSDRLKAELEQYDHVSYEGYVDAKETLAGANVMLHPTNLDGQPNSVLEGLASGLPVITNDWVEFVQFDGPLSIAYSTQTLEARLFEHTDPEIRRDIGSMGEQYIRQQHSPERIAKQYEGYFMEVLHESD